jgi:DNA invertase Pin-like site-specific DNA recombinase
MSMQLAIPPSATLPAKITTGHLARAAFVYVRQSTLTQVQDNLESQRRQYGLVDQARAWGWHRVEVIDDDLGRSGGGRTSRPGFERLVSAVCLEEAGAVFAVEVSRFARNSRDWAHLVDLCGLTGTLIIDDEGVYDPRETNDRLLLGLKGTMSEWELSVMRQRSFAALRQKAARGALYTTVPIGFLRTRDDRVELDPDQRIQQAIQLVFQQFRATGSVRQTLLWFRQEQIELPAVDYGPFGRAVVWKLPVYNAVHHILTNPIYAGAYAFGRTRTQTTVVAGQARKRHGVAVPRDQWTVLLQDHHDGYITWREYEAIQHQIAENAYMEGQMTRGAPREGAALLAGLLRCRRCGRRLHVAYGGRGAGATRYACRGAHLNHGTAWCLSFGGLALERAVETAILALMQPAALDAALAAGAQVAAARAAEREHHALRVEQARYEAERARRQYDSVDPEHRLVAAELERRWNTALDALAATEQALAKFDADASKEAQATDAGTLRALATDLPGVWNDSRADARVKKRIVRTLIEEILVDVDEEAGVIQAVVRWTGGQHSAVSVQKRRTGQHRYRTDADAVTLIRELSLMLPDAQIAGVLNRLGVRTAKGLGWTRNRVCIVRNHEGIPVHDPARAAQEGWLTMDGAAAQAGVSVTVIRKLIDRKILPARQVVTHAPWMIRASDLSLAGVTHYVNGVRAGRALPRTADANQLNLVPSTTY